MKDSVFRALEQYVIDHIIDGHIDDDNKNDWFEIVFSNQYTDNNILDPEEWLQAHEISPWEAINFVIDADYRYCGSVVIDIKDMNPKGLVNWIAFFSALELDFDAIYKKNNKENMTITIRSEHNFMLPKEAKPSDILIIGENKRGELMVDYKGEKYTSYFSDCNDMEFS